MQFLLELAWRDLRSSGKSLWIFCACLILGVTLVSASSSLYRMISAGLLADTRILMGGDVEIDAREPLPENILAWIRENGDVSVVTEVDTMLGSEQGGFTRVELQSMDALYPLYGELQLEPSMDLQTATAFTDGYWGVALDPVIADRIGVTIGDEVYVGSLAMKVRARIINQPDRNLSADWRGTPVLLAPGALQDSGLIVPGSRIEYDYHIRTSTNAEIWRDRFYAAFPDEVWEVRTFNDRSRRLSERLGQIASGLLIIGFSTLFIGGLGVFNSIHAYLRGKLKTIATLRALGLRNRNLALVYLLQIGILSGGASIAGILIGSLMALTGAAVIMVQVPVVTTLQGLLLPNLMAAGFGIFTAYTFALPAVGLALSVQPASLFRGTDIVSARTPAAWRTATLVCGISIVVLVLAALPDALFGVGFVATVVILLGLLDLLVRLIQHVARRLDGHPALAGRFVLRLAMANLHRPGSPLRTSLLSLGSALTLLVACTLVVGSLVRTINTTIPAESPALVLYDISNDQLGPVREAITQSAGTVRVETTPLVRSRIAGINGQTLEQFYDSNDEHLRDASQDEYKLSYSAGNIDGVTLVSGEWWTEPGADLPWMAMEDREAEQLGVKLGDTLSFAIEGRSLEARIAAIYSQKGVQTKFWFEAIMADGSLEPFINRHVGAAYMDDNDAVGAQNRIAAVAPNVITVRTAALLAAARELLGQASAGLAVVAGISLAASVLVLISVMATGRARQIYDATVLHSLGARMAQIRRSLHIEYLLLSVITSVFAILLGSGLALPLLTYRLKLPSGDLIWLGAVTAFSVSVVALGLGARYLLARLKVRPAVLLRNPV